VELLIEWDATLDKHRARVDQDQDLHPVR